MNNQETFKAATISQIHGPHQLTVNSFFYLNFHLS